MEGPNKQEKTFEEQIELARLLIEAVSRRNELLRRYPDWDDMVVFVNANQNNRDLYEGMEKTANEARKKFDQEVSDKKAVIDYFRQSGETDNADLISMMFRVK